MYSSRNDLPNIQRLNTVHYDGVPVEHLHEHFVFVYKSTVLVMDYSKPKIRISVRGYYQNHWYSSWRTLGEYDVMHKAEKSWSKAVYLVLLSHFKLRGKEQQLDFFQGLFL